MADIDIDPFGDHDKTGAQPDETGKNIPLNPEGVGGIGATWEIECEQEMSFRGSLRTKAIREYVKGLYQKISESMGTTPKEFNLDYPIYYNDFELRDRELYYKGKSKPLTIRRGKLRSVAVIEGLHNLGKKERRTSQFKFQYTHG